MSLRKLLQPVLALPYLTRSFITLVSLLTSAFYITTVVRRQRPGLPRVLAALPCVPLHLFIPLLFDPFNNECLPVFQLGGCVVWLGTFRLATFCWDQGSASPKEYASHFPSFFVSLYFPTRVIPAAKVDPVRSVNFGWLSSSLIPAYLSAWPRILLETAVKLVILNLLFMYQSTGLAMPWPGYFVHFLVLLFILSTSTDLFSAIVKLFVPQLEVLPGFYRVFHMSSIREGWGRSWNLLISDCLRDAVYIPVVYLLTLNDKKAKEDDDVAADGGKNLSEGGEVVQTADGLRRRVKGQDSGEKDTSDKLMSVDSSSSDGIETHKHKGKPPSKVVQAIATMSTFVASGIMHNVGIWYRSRDVSFLIFIFFIFHGSVCLLESAVKSTFKWELKQSVPWPWHTIIVLSVCAWSGRAMFFNALFSLPNNLALVNEIRALFGHKAM